MNQTIRKASTISIWGNRSAIFAGAVATLIFGYPLDALSAVKISSAATKNITCSGGTCTPSHKNAVLNVNDLQSLLAASSIKITTDGATAGDIRVEAPLTWASSNALKLDAYGSVIIASAVTDEGTGGVTLVTSDGGFGGALVFDKTGSLSFLGLSNSLTIGSTAYTLVGDVATLASDIAANSSGHYALARNYNAQADGAYSQVPIPTSFMGTFEGLGNRISHLSVVDSTDQVIGLFGQIGPTGVVRDFGLLHANFHSGNQNGGDIAIVAGFSVGTVANCIVTGRVSSEGSTTQDEGVGGLVGFNGGTISGSESAAKILASASDQVGGLTAFNSGTIINSFSKGAVSATNDGALSAKVGGLTGWNFGHGLVLGSYASGAVSGNSGDSVGGLIGVQNTGGETAASYWDTTTSGSSSSAGGTPLTTAQLQAALPAGFNPLVWAEKSSVGDGLPYLVDTRL